MKHIPRKYVPDRGDVVWLHFTPQIGHEQTGHRPAIVLSPASYNKKSGLALMCPITSKIKGYPFETELNIVSSSPVIGVILADQVKSLDWQARQATFIAKVPAATVEDVVAKLLALIS